MLFIVKNLTVSFLLMCYGALSGYYKETLCTQ